MVNQKATTITLLGYMTILYVNGFDNVEYKSHRNRKYNVVDELVAVRSRLECGKLCAVSNCLAFVVDGTGTSCQLLSYDKSLTQRRYILQDNDATLYLVSNILI